MRVRLTSVLGFTAVTALLLPACSPTSTTAKPATAPSPRASTPAATERSEAPLSSTTLATRLLSESDLGADYVRKAERPAQHDDVTIVGCPALDKLGDAAMGGSLDFPRQAKATFTYASGSSSEVSEELYSDAPAKLSTNTSRIFGAISSCPTYQVVSGSTAVDIRTQKTTAPKLGDEQWGQFLTFSAGGRDSIAKQTAIRDGNLLLVVSGSPALVDRHVAKALAKATR
ncbi:hypothetical protein [Streptomyces noursei]|uniref:hypothetical protein n=1 Tax=Streptomyces noursei TaxID=1971 RepID=UPI00045F0387|nr:hypothetical protein [Streptomyces noursei]AIA06695.1 hypothetical protein DC74_6256 [Streptomyces noursei]